MKSLCSEFGKRLRISAVAVSVLASSSTAVVGQQVYSPYQQGRPYDTQAYHQPYNDDRSQFRNGFSQGSGNFGQGFNGRSDDRYYGDRRHDDHHGGIGTGGGAGIGAAGGAVLGAAFGGGIKGTLIGGAVGAGLGAAIASAAKKKDRDRHHDFHQR